MRSALCGADKSHNRIRTVRCAQRQSTPAIRGSPRLHALHGSQVQYLHINPRSDELVQLPSRTQLDKSFVVVVLQHNPHVPGVLHGLPHALAAESLDHVDPQRDVLRRLGHVLRPELAHSAVELRQNLQPFQGRRRCVLQRSLQKRRAIVHQDGGPGWREPHALGDQVARVALTQGARPGHLHTERLPVLFAQLLEATQDGRGVHLRLAHQPHLGNRGVARWHRPKRGLVLRPPHLQVLLHDLRLSSVGDPLHELEGAQEAVEDLQRELHRELLRAAQRRRLSPGQVCKPMDEVQRHVLLAELRLVVADERLAELRERGPGGRLALDEPPVVEAEVALCELHRPLLLGVQVVEGRQHLRVALHDVGERHVVVADGVAGGEALVGRVALHHLGEQDGHLHDVVHRSERQKGDQALLVDDVHRLSAQPSPLLFDQARVDEEFPEAHPNVAVVELAARLLAVDADRGAGLRGRGRRPCLVHAE
mmetsp:Transcript_57597/g.166736  ORF Transcript_57597/g.166736 Transcript_57597/m.166736 type:complete len:480 (+) Transcript_57597:64-1503(+)